jgi:hypothetical protein
MGDVNKRIRNWWKTNIYIFKGLQKKEGIDVNEEVFDRNNKLLRKWKMEINEIYNNYMYMRN